MVPPSGGSPRPPGPAPRTRGDGPNNGYIQLGPGVCSPHPRGWSLLVGDKTGEAVLLPAPAGMVPPPKRARRTPPAAPRTRGDGPSLAAKRKHEMGCSPHPRGWSLIAAADRLDALLLPAPAGMVPSRGSPAAVPLAAPRTRGDGPLCCFFPKVSGVLLPAPAGMVLLAAARVPGAFSAPRTRGDGPDMGPLMGTAKTCSPHPRGWSRCRHARLPVGRLLPAPAGMVPAAL